MAIFHEDMNTDISTNAKNLYLTSLISGGTAGVICDLAFFPFDTLKTRLQSQHGFIKSGGFKRLYQGLGPVLVGSAPSASLFFVTYEAIKAHLLPQVPPEYHFFVHMGAATTGELFACLIRVPIEVMKQRKQALIVDNEGLGLKTLYRGYGSTVLRDVPFGLIQMPLWEYFKHTWRNHVHRECNSYESALCGAASVAISATLTTPLDVAKTRIMLACKNACKKDVRISTMLREVYQESGVRGLYAGYLPRVFAFTLGGSVFFGVYEEVRAKCRTIFPIPGV